MKSARAAAGSRSSPPAKRAGGWARVASSQGSTLVPLPPPAYRDTRAKRTYGYSVEPSILPPSAFKGICESGHPDFCPSTKTGTLCQNSSPRQIKRAKMVTYKNRYSSSDERPMISSNLASTTVPLASSSLNTMFVARCVGCVGLLLIEMLSAYK